MNLLDELNQTIKPVGPKAKTLAEMLPNADAAEGAREIAAAKAKGLMHLSLRDIDDQDAFKAEEREAAHA